MPASLLKRHTRAAVYDRATILGLCGRRIRHDRHEWTPAEDTILRDTYHLGNTVADLPLSRTPDSIYKRAMLLGLTGRSHGYRCTQSGVREQLSALTPQEIAYIAGLFDGEGFIHPYSQPPRQITITNTDKNVMDWLLFRIPAGSVTVRQPSRPNRKVVYNFHLSNKLGMYDFLVAMEPFSVIKKQKVSDAIAALLDKYPHLPR